MTEIDQGNAAKSPRRSIARRLSDKLTVLLSILSFRGSAHYWDLRYRVNGSSGAGSYGAEARFKADFINRFLLANAVDSVIDFGCGDGAQLALLSKVSYLGVDVSPTAVLRCRQRYSDDDAKRFCTAAEFSLETADLAMSLDVVYHLVEHDVFQIYMDRLFGAARRFVLVYSTNRDEEISRHVRHRDLTKFCEKRYPGFELSEQSATAPSAPANGPRFFVFTKTD